MQRSWDAGRNRVPDGRSADGIHRSIQGVQGDEGGKQQGALRIADRDREQQPEEGVRRIQRTGRGKHGRGMERGHEARERARAQRQAREKDNAIGKS